MYAQTSKAYIIKPLHIFYNYPEISLIIRQNEFTFTLKFIWVINILI